MTLEELKTKLEVVLPNKVVYHAWPVGSAPELPFIVINSIGSDNFGADNVVYYGKRVVRVELLAETKALALESSIEAVLPYWTRTEDYLSDEKCYLTTYEIEVL